VLTRAFAQDSNESETIKVDTVLINIPVIASDRDGRFVAGLKKENFFIIESGERRNVDLFEDVEAPLNVAILIDSSLSTSGVLGDIKKAAREFVKTLRPEDQCLVATFDSKLHIEITFNSDVKKLNKTIDRVNVAREVGSNMFDSLHFLISKSFYSIKGRKAIIVLTDGRVGPTKDVSDNKLLDTLAESDVLVYPILFEPGEDLRTSFRNLPASTTRRDGTILKKDDFKRILQSLQVLK